MGLAIAATIAANQSTISDPAFYEAISKSISSVSLDPLLNYINRPQSNVIESIKQTYTDSKAITSPIILDLDGDGIETTAVGSGTWFDHDANGFAESTGWAGSDDGILVRDLDGNGTIDSGRELFGSETLLANGQKAANGFQALAELDSNLDGKIDASDAAYTTLNIWKDVDGDGTTDAGELLTLAEAGVQSLNVGYTASTAIDANGNQHQQIGSYTTTTGTTRAAEDVWFKVDKLNTLAEDWIAVSADIAALPDVTGYGNVYDLHQAMARDTTGQLKALVEQFAAATDTATRDALVADILYKWSGSDAVAAGSRGPYFDSRRLAVLEKFMGEAYTAASCTLGVSGPNPHDMGAPILRQAWSQLVELVSSQLSAQTNLKPLYDMVTYTWDATSQSLKGNLTQVIADLDARIATDPVAGQALLVEFARSIHGMGTEAQLDYAGLRTHYAADTALVKSMDYSETLAGTAGNDVIDGGNGHDLITGGAGDDTLSGGDGDDHLDGGAGADTLIGGAGDDVLGGDHWADDFYGVGNTYQGGTGNDELRGTVGADTYIFNLGDGKDSIHDYDNGTGALDTIRFGAGITAGDIQVSRVDNNLLLNHVNGSDSVFVTGWYASSYYQIERIEFADGTVWNGTTLQSSTAIVHGTGANDTMVGNAGTDTLYGLDGNDNLQGGLGNDVLDGGAGDDTLTGGAGNDTYVLARGYGQDTIIQSDTNNTETDTASFVGINATNVAFHRYGNDLYTVIKDDWNTRFWIKNYFAGSAYVVERFQFADGTVWSDTNVKSNTTTYGTAGADNITGYNGAPNIMYGYDGNDYFTGGDGSDKLDGGNGDDTLIGQAGNDTLLGQAGNDGLQGGAGNDMLDGGAGDDTLTGGAGNDTYVLARGYGQDTIIQSDTTNTETDTASFVGINAADVVLHRLGNDLYTVIKDDWNTRFYIPNYFSGSTYLVERFAFADGVVLGDAEVKNQVFTFGTANADTMTGFTGSTNRLYGQGGNDILTGGTLDDYLDGGAGNDTLSGGLGNDIYVVDATTDVVTEAASAGIDTVKSAVTWTLGSNLENLILTGATAINGADNALNNLLQGNSVVNTLSGGTGNDILQGMAGNDILTDTSGNNLLDGGAGDDTITGNIGNELIFGGLGSDTITTNTGYDVIAFNKGDGADILNVSTGADNTISLGGGVTYTDLSLSKSGTDLIFKAGATDQITLKDWYASTSNHSVLNLQVIAEAMADFAPGGSDVLKDNKVETFNFAGLVGAFDTALAAAPTLSNWALTNALLDFHLGSGSDTDAIGGDLAYQYGKAGTLAGIGLTASQSVINSAQFGQTAQALHAASTWQSETIKLG